MPYRDPGYTTVLNANRIVRECLVGLALRKKGITQPGYLDPLTSGRKSKPPPKTHDKKFKRRKQ